MLRHKIIVAGIGPGNPDYILPAARRAIQNAKILVGGKRALADFAQRDGVQETFSVTGDIAGVMKFIRARSEKEEVVVMVSGDPGYYSLLDALRGEFEAGDLTVYPGISSVQFAFSRLALPWHGARLLSMHGRTAQEKDLAYTAGALLGILTDGKYTSHSIPKILLEHGWPRETELHVCSRLSYADETICSTTLGAAEELPEETHCILVVKA